jgi:hypothetical protein
LQTGRGEGCDGFGIKEMVGITGKKEYEDIKL